MAVKLYTDGGARGNPGPAAAAFVLEDEDGVVLDSRGDAIGVQTNNVAEYTALVNGLRRAAELGLTEIEVVSDSELMVKQMRGEYKIKNAALRELSIEATRLARTVGRGSLHRGATGAQRARRQARERRARRRRVGRTGGRSAVSWDPMTRELQIDRTADLGLLALALLLPR